jgi:hypothetical protein
MTNVDVCVLMCGWITIREKHNETTSAALGFWLPGMHRWSSSTTVTLIFCAQLDPLFMKLCLPFRAFQQCYDWWVILKLKLKSWFCCRCTSQQKWSCGRHPATGASIWLSMMYQQSIEALCFIKSLWWGKLGCCICSWCLSMEVLMLLSHSFTTSRHGMYKKDWQQTYSLASATTFLLLLHWGCLVFK